MRVTLPIAALALLLLPAVQATEVVGLGQYFLGVLTEGEEDRSADFPPSQVLGPPVCGAVIVDIRVRLTLHASEGLAELEVDPLDGPPVRVLTEGSPPEAVVEYRSPDDCPRFVVRGVSLAMPTAYEVRTE